MKMPPVPDNLDDLREVARLLCDGLDACDAPFHRPEVVPGGYVSSLFEPVEDLEAVANALRLDWETEMRRTGSFLMTVYLFGTRDPYTHAPGNVLVRVKWRDDDEASHLLNYSPVWKNNLANVARAFSLFSQARCAVMASDAWRASGPEVEAYRQTDEFKRSGLHHYAKREEIIALNLETRQAHAAVAVPYTRVGSVIMFRPPEHEPATKITGRFSSFLHAEVDPLTGKAAV